MINSIKYIIFWISLLRLFSLISSYTPYSECTQGRITAYDEYEEGGSCGFGIPKMYGAAPNEAFYNLGEKCGICYELVGPNGVLLFMVDSHCPVKGNEHSCSGDMLHFDLHKNGFDTIVDEGIGRLNVTFRMVSCDHESNMILKTKKDVSKYFFSFVILYHNIGLKKVYYSYDNETWTGLEREGDYNHWTIRSVELPLYIQLESISGEKVETTINEIIADNYYDTGVQFSVPNKMYDPFSLKEIKSPKVEGCCKLDDAYTDIYYEGKYLGEWQDISNCEPENEYSENCYEGKKCIKVNFKDWNVYQFFNRIQPETKRYNAIKFAIKTENTCDKCLKIKLDDYSFYSISTSEAGKWEEKVLTLEELGLTSSTKKFRKFMFQGSKKDSQIIYFDSIKLVKSDYDDQGEYSNDSQEKKDQDNISTIEDNELNKGEENNGSVILKESIGLILIINIIISLLIV
ncbi:hypothetical protein U3516DRAFT_821546 [Neocallimastix sp. 'constans']